MWVIGSGTDGSFSLLNGGGKVVNLGDSIYYLVCFAVLFALIGGIVFGIYWVIRHFKWYWTGALTWSGESLAKKAHLTARNRQMGNQLLTI